MAPGEQGRPARRALRLDVVVQELKALAGEGVDPRRGRAAQHSAPIAAELAPAEVVPEEEDDVRLLVGHPDSPLSVAGYRPEPIPGINGAGKGAGSSGMPAARRVVTAKIAFPCAPPHPRPGRRCEPLNPRSRARYSRHSTCRSPKNAEALLAEGSSNAPARWVNACHRGQKSRRSAEKAHSAIRAQTNNAVSAAIPLNRCPYTKGAEEALVRAGQLGWTVVSIKNDWTTVFKGGGAP